MKNTTKIIGALLITAAAATSCVDESLLPFDVPTKPGSLEDYEYLKEYDVLKSYLDRSKYPNFKVSAAVEAGDFTSGSAVTRIVSTNFDEVVAGNAFKMASCVSDKGEFSYGTVQEFVSNAENNGLTVYGHTLAWHAQQPYKWLNKLIADKPIPVDPGAAKKEVQVGFVDFTTMSSFPYYVMGYTPTFDTGVLHSEYPGEWYQYFIADGISIPKEGDYTAIVKIKSDRPGTLTLNMGWGWGEGESASGKLEVGEDWKESVVNYTGIPEKSVNLVLQPGVFEGPIDIEWVKIVYYEAGSANVEYVTVYENQIENSEMKEGGSMDNFIVRDATSAQDHPGEVLVGQGPNGMNCLKVVGKTNPSEEWDTQFFIYTPNKTWESGEKYTLHMWYKANKAIGTDSQCHGAPGAYMHWQMLSPNPSFTTEWQEKTWTGTIPGEGNGMQSIAFNLNKNKSSDPTFSYEYYFAGIEWSAGYEKEIPKVEIVTVDYVENTDMEGDDAHNFVRKENNGALENVITAGAGKNGSRGVSVTSKAGAEQDWDTQFWIKMNDGMWLESGDQVTVQFDYRASTAATGDTQAHGNPGAYQHWACIGSVNFTTEWQTYTYNLTVDGSMAGSNGLGSIAFNLAKDRNQDVTYYFDNIRVWSEREEEVKSTIPLTEEEKRDTLTYAMNKWITGMMNATEGKVKSWDLINEAISGAGNVNGFYDLQHTNAAAPNDFFWQDYFGSENYGVIMEKLAREAYANVEAETPVNPADLKLFINDYNLESDWDDNHKLKSLIYWIGVWEQGGAKIDGIGSQMHISLYENASTQESKKKAITNMFKLMADATSPVDGHKYLVRISELDMGIVDAEGNTVKSSEMTLEREKAMADFYQWIVEQYLTIVPADQQYGMCQWCLTDSPKGSGWRAEEPVGLWYSDYTRKPAYAGWAEGLKK